MLCDYFVAVCPLDSSGSSNTTSLKARGCLHGGWLSNPAKVRASRGVGDKEETVEELFGARRVTDKSAACRHEQMGRKAARLLRFCQKGREGGGRCF